jgi:hypothetical protein
LADRIWAVAVAAEASSPPPREARRVLAVATAEVRMPCRLPRRRAVVAAPAVRVRRLVAALAVRVRLSPRRVSWSRLARRP